jgi:cation transport ATPase/YHS domain-containing protein
MRPTRERDACAKCGTLVDPLRAARVRLIANRFFYFCSQNCAETFNEDDFRSSPPPAAKTEPIADRAEPAPAADDGHAKRTSPTQPPPATSTPPVRHTPMREAAAPEQVPPTAERATGTSDESLLRGALLLGGLSLTLVLALESLWTLALRLLLAGAGVAFLLVYARRDGSRPEAPRPLEVVTPTVLTIGVAGALVALGRPWAAQGVTLSAGLLLSAALSAYVLRRRTEPVAQRIEHIRQGLAQNTSRLQSGQLLEVAAEQLRAGDEILIHAGETVPADVTVTSGRAEVHPWLDATLVRVTEPGDSLYAGARLSSGQLRATVRWTGHDRHWQRLVSDPARRADLWAPLVSLGRRGTRRGALGVLALTATVSLLLGVDGSLSLLWLLALGSAVLAPALYVLPALRTTSTVLDLLDRGVVARSAAVLEAAGKISTAVFCARGTLLLGEPELSNLESYSSLTNDELLSLVVGAEQYSRHAVAVTVSRAARARGIRPDAVRTPQALSGLGVTALTSDGKHLVVGSRALMLKERISVARAEDRIAEIEASGRTVLLVAVAQRLVGLVALQDGLRPGARAAVQHLLDAGIEPVLMSGDARQTCEALGKTIDVEHIRPEVLPGERGAEVERLRSGGANVAVVGRSPTDDVALAAATVSIALPSSGSRSNDFDIELASDEVQTAAMALHHAHRCRRQTLRGMSVLVSGAGLGCLLVLGAGLPPAVVPLVSVTALFLADLATFSSNG